MNNERAHVADDRGIRTTDRRPGPVSAAMPTTGDERALQRRANAVNASGAVVRLRALGAMTVPPVIQRMAYDELRTGTYYRVTGHEDVLYLRSKSRIGRNLFTPHSSMTLPVFEVADPAHVERSATAEEVTVVDVNAQLRRQQPRLDELRQLQSKMAQRAGTLRDPSIVMREEERRTMIDLNIEAMDHSRSIAEPLIRDIFGAATTYRGVLRIMTMFLDGKLPGTPWSTGALMPESNMLLEQLKALTAAGLVTYESQPSGQSTPIEGTEVQQHQAAYLEISGEAALMNELATAIGVENALHGHQITIIEPGAVVEAALRVGVATIREAFEPLSRVEAGDIVERDDGFSANLYTRVNNNARYLNAMKAVPGLASILEGHVTLFLLSSTFRDADATLMFDRLVKLVARANEALARKAVAARVRALDDEPAMANEDMPTAEELGIGHLDDLR
jgi:hypothetical protein